MPAGSDLIRASIGTWAWKLLLRETGDKKWPREEAAASTQRRTGIVMGQSEEEEIKTGDEATG